jgi:hypothetical protein
MEKKEIKSHVYHAGQDFINDNTPLFLRGWKFKTLEGQLMTILEAAGLSEKQEEAIKSFIRQAIWGNLDDGSVVVLSEKDDAYVADPIFSANGSATLPVS